MLTGYAGVAAWLPARSVATNWTTLPVVCATPNGIVALNVCAAVVPSVPVDWASAHAVQVEPPFVE